MMAKKTQRKTIQERREGSLSHLSREYKDAVLYTIELRRAIDSFSGPLPDNSPYRYVRSSVAEAIIDFLSRSKKPASIPHLVKELQAGSCVFGSVKSPTEIVGKVVRAYASDGRLQWADASKTKAKLPERK